MIKEISRERLMELRQLLQQLTNEQLSAPLEVLHGATVGMHLRHILEFYQCLFISLDSGELNYDLRRRDSTLEVDKARGEASIDVLLEKLQAYGSDRPLRLTADYSLGGQSREILQETTYFRELLYNVEHCVHHLAIIKIGIRELAPDMQLGESLGVAASTIRNRGLCAQ